MRRQVALLFLFFFSFDLFMHLADLKIQKVTRFVNAAFYSTILEAKS